MLFPRGERDFSEDSPSTCLSGSLSSTSRMELWLSNKPVLVTVRGASMVPFLHDGDEVKVVETSPDRLGKGDLVVFVRSGELTVHRFLESSSGRFLEKGDAQAMGNWHPWPDTIGVVVCLRKGKTWEDLTGTGWAARLQSEGRRHLRRHLAERAVTALPWSLLRRGVRFAVRHFPGRPW